MFLQILVDKDIACNCDRLVRGLKAGDKLQLHNVAHSRFYNLKQILNYSDNFHKKPHLFRHLKTCNQDTEIEILIHKF